MMSSEQRDEKIRMNRIRRERQLRRHMLIFFAAIAMICVILVITLCINVKAAESSADVKCYKSVMVCYDDDLDSFSRSNFECGDFNRDHYKSAEDYRDEIVSINHLENTSIHPGQYVIVPYYSDLNDVTPTQN